MAITGRTIRLEQALRKNLADVTDEQARELVKAWATAWDEVSADLTAALLEQLVAGETVSRAQLLRSTRLRKALTVIAARLDELFRAAGVSVTSTLRDVIDVAGGAQASIIDSQLPARAPQLVDLDAWSRVDARQVDAIVRRSTQQITSRLRPLSAQSYAAVRKELIRGVVTGSNPRQTARRMVDRAEGRFNGGLARALTIARTETIDAHRAAAQIAQAEHADVLQGWEWVATLGPRTCPACWSMHGTLHELTEPGPLGHQNCRCARVPKVKPWTDLGLTGTEAPSLLPDRDTAFAAMSKPEQVAVLGPRGWKAWNSGKFPPSDWARRRETDGWRDSYVPAKPPAVAGGGSGRGTRGPTAAPAGAPEPGRVIIPEGLKLRQWELDTGHRVARLGHDVEFQLNPHDVKSADAVILGQIWEMKSPTGTGASNIVDNLRRAMSQSQAVILDLARTDLTVDQVVKQIRDYWSRPRAKYVETVWVIPHDVQNHFTMER